MEEFKCHLGMISNKLEDFLKYNKVKNRLIMMNIILYKKLMKVQKLLKKSLLMTYKH